jgi:hypothetical protein
MFTVYDHNSLLADFDQHSKLGLVTCPSVVPLRNSHQQETDDAFVGGANHGNAVAIPWHALSATLSRPVRLRVVLLQCTEMLTNAICSFTALAAWHRITCISQRTTPAVIRSSSSQHHRGSHNFALPAEPIGLFVLTMSPKGCWTCKGLLPKSPNSYANTY